MEILINKNSFKLLISCSDDGSSCWGLGGCADN